jgi:SAM-dependent methyltransferase
VARAAQQWAEDLAAWEIPKAILDAAPESPWGFPPALFAREAAERAASPGTAGPSRDRAAEALAGEGSVLDVGSGGGAASLALVPLADLLVAVDQSEELLRSFSEAADRRGVVHHEVQGTWPDVAAEVDAADVVVCHHVLYNVADLVPFVMALTDHARRRVVVELTVQHPQVALNHLWQALHGLERPNGPTAQDARAVLVEAGLNIHAEEWERPSLWAGVERAERVAFARRRLCVGPERDAEIDALLGPDHEGPLRRAVTLWWDGGG